ncbi:MAG TPA: cation diffusion facilitator family transporter [Burkholderiales bacterium]|nr:cation diffusion facilitator family transporter [Burkholderiales bacterium]
MAAETTQSVVAAIVGNLLVTATKLVAAAFSGSSAMLSEAIHSLVDSGNGVLMLYGMRRSLKPPDEHHPLGYGHELYFWTLVVGILIFGLGGGMSIVTGIMHMIGGKAPEAAWWSYAVLGAAGIFEGSSWYFGWKAFRKEQRQGRGIMETIVVSKNPTTFSVLLEDTAALLGLVLAFAGIYFSALFNLPWLDGAASVLIGVLLCVSAVIMVYESMGLLVGEGMEPATLAELRRIVAADPAVQQVNHLLTLYLGPEDVLLAIDLRFRPDTDVHDIRAAVARFRKAIQDRYPRIRRICLDTTLIGITPPPSV